MEFYLFFMHGPKTDMPPGAGYVIAPETFLTRFLPGSKLGNWVSIL